MPVGADTIRPHSTFRGSPGDGPARPGRRFWCQKRRENHQGLRALDPESMAAVGCVWPAKTRPALPPASSAQVSDHSLRRKRQSSLLPLCPCSRRGIAIPGPNWPANRAAPFSRLALSATGGASPGNSPHRTRFAGLRRGPRVHLRHRRCRALGGTHRDYPASSGSRHAVPTWPAGPPSVPCLRNTGAVTVVCERRMRYKVSLCRRYVTCRTARGKIQKGGRNPLFGRFKGWVQGGGNRNPPPAPSFPPFLREEMGAPAA